MKNKQTSATYWLDVVRHSKRRKCNKTVKVINSMAHEKRIEVGGDSREVDKVAVKENIICHIKIT